MNLIGQWIQMYEGQRKQGNVLVSSEFESEIELSNEKDDLSNDTGNEELETQSENGTHTSNVIEIVEYVSHTTG